MEWIDLEFFESRLFKEDILGFLKTARKSGRVVLPPKRKILRALELTPPNAVKVVILGQDPYPTKGHANGLAFSVEPDVSPLPKSLINIYKELHDDLGVVRENGDLTDWAEQGVLLLNSVFTTAEGIADAHRNIGWETLSTEIIKYLSLRMDGIVFILWGSAAAKNERLIDKSRHYIIKSVHPSPLAAYRGFFGSKPFSETNKYLTSVGKKPIKW